MYANVAPCLLEVKINLCQLLFIQIIITVMRGVKAVISRGAM